MQAHHQWNHWRDVNTAIRLSDAEREHFLGKDRYFWDAYAQGRLARYRGDLRTSNPFDLPPLQTHANVWDWYRGWDKGW